MKISSLLVTLGLLLCAGLGIALVEIKADSRALAGQQAEVEHVTRTLETKLVAIRHDLGNEVKHAAALAVPAEQWHEFGRIPPDKIRQLVAPTLAAIKASHARRAPSPRQPPPPTGPMGSLFPELMDEPRYSFLAKQQGELLISLECRARLEHAGVPPQTIDHVLDLLAEQRMIALDYQSLRPQYQRYGRAAYAQQQAAVAKIETQIRTALGSDMFDRLSSPVPHVTTTVHADGTVTETTTTTRELEPYGKTAELALKPLETRLSYSPEPLSPEQLSQLAAIREDHLRNGPPVRTSADELTLPELRAVLSPFQLTALAQLEAEHEAMMARSKLPGS